MSYLLDTNTVIALLTDASSPAATRVRRCRPDEVAISALVVHELFYGAYKSQRTTQNVARVDALMFEVLSFDTEDAREAGEIRAHLAVQGVPIGAYDVLSAGQARARALTLVTHNVREFARVPRLQVEDWHA